MKDTPKTDAEEKVSEAEPTGKRRRLYVIWGSVFVGIIVVTLLTLHKTSLHQRFDPLGRMILKTRVAVADDPVEKAHLQLSLSEEKLREFQSLRTKNASDTHLNTLANEMTAHNREAIINMDAAKQGGTDIKKIQLVKRLCDLLGEEAKELSATYHQFKDQHDFAALLEDKVEAGVELEQAIEQVNKSLSEAMKW